MDCFMIEKDSSLIRVFHASPDAPRVDVYVDGNLVFSDLAFKDFTEYVNLKEGEYKIDVYVSGETENPVISEVLEIDDGEIYTVAATGKVDNLSLLVIPDYIEKVISKKYSTFRVIHLSPDTPAVDIYVDNEILFKDIEFREGTNYVDVNSGKYNVKIVVSGTDNVVVPLKLNLKLNRIYTLYALGNISNLEVIQSVDGNTYVCR